MSTLQILTPTDIRNYSSPPRFDSFRRKKFFALLLGLMKEIKNMRTPNGEIAFVLQCGYFQASKRFFGKHFYQSDLTFVANRLSLEVSFDLARHRQIISTFIETPQFKSNRI